MTIGGVAHLRMRTSTWKDTIPKHRETLENLEQESERLPRPVSGTGLAQLLGSINSTAAGLQTCEVGASCILWETGAPVLEIVARQRSCCAGGAHICSERTQLLSW